MQQSIATLITIALAATSSLAAPHMAKRQYTVPADTQSCVSVQGYTFGEADHCNYHIVIGEAFNGGSGCSDLQDRLEGALGTDMSSFGCSDNGYGDTAIGFTSADCQGDKINASLDSFYPMVNGFNCPVSKSDKCDGFV